MDYTNREYFKLNILSIFFYFIFPVFSIGPFVKLRRRYGFLKGCLINLLIFFVLNILIKFSLFLNLLSSWDLIFIQLGFDFILYFVFVFLAGLISNFILNIDFKKLNLIFKIILLSFLPLIFFVMLYIFRNSLFSDIVLSNISEIFNSINDLKLNEKLFNELLENIKFFFNFIYPRVIFPLSLIFGFLIYENIMYYDFYGEENYKSISIFKLNNFYSWIFLFLLYVFIFVVFILKLKNDFIEKVIFNIFFGFVILFFFQGLSVLFFKIENSILEPKIIKRLKVLFFLIYLILTLSSLYLFIILFFLISAVGILENIFNWRNKLINTGGNK